MKFFVSETQFAQSWSHLGGTICTMGPIQKTKFAQLVLTKILGDGNLNYYIVVKGNLFSLFPRNRIDTDPNEVKAKKESTPKKAEELIQEHIGFSGKTAEEK